MSFPIAVLLSGSGTTLQNLLTHIRTGTLPVRIVAVIASKPNVLGVARARDAGLPTHVVERNRFASVDAFSAATFAICREAGAQLVCMAGYLQLLHIPADYQGKVLNIHPSLLPAFGGRGMYGHHVHEAVLHYGAKISGCTVHFADNEYDHGPIVLQRSVPVADDDTPDTLAARVFQEECAAYPEAVRAYAEGRLRQHGRHVRILPPSQ